MYDLFSFQVRLGQRAEVALVTSLHHDVIGWSSGKTSCLADFVDFDRFDKTLKFRYVCRGTTADSYPLDSCWLSSGLYEIK